ncbi:MAG: UDP-N-acetylmuramate--L-alanine ligase [Armatimonadetes bacterium]|nr:UDP-N-acetylmuramate--L-alanine ligase [Armatimonadota bacterium]
MTLDVDQLSVDRARHALETCQRFHFMGIGGIGMSGLARWLARQGRTVSGCDRNESDRLEFLRREGIATSVEHNPSHVQGTDCLVYTTAVPQTNEELAAARQAGLRVLHRAEVLAAIAATRRSIAVTGTHGKSTTTAMVGTILETAGLDPLVFVGADAPMWQGNARFGNGQWCVFEACESDGTIVLYQNCSQVLTSLEPDHLDQYGTFENLQKFVKRFLASADQEGFVVYCADSQIVTELVDAAQCQRVGYGLGAGEYRATDIQMLAGGSTQFCMHSPAGRRKVRLQLCGTHNVLNALAAVAAAEQAGADAELAVQALGRFPGLSRRFEKMGTLGTSIVIDDYAHHPTEVRAVLSTARDYLRRPIVAIFQPHLFSRTRDFMDEFAQVFAEADEAIFTDIYPAREAPIPGVTSEELAHRAAAVRPDRPTYYLAGLDEVTDFVRRNYRDGWAVLVIGAGDVRKVAEALVEEA